MGWKSNILATVNIINEKFYPDDESRGQSTTEDWHNEMQHTAATERYGTTQNT